MDSEARNGVPATPIKPDALPDLAGALYYVGGVPPGYKALRHFRASLRPEPEGKPIVPFLGCMSLIQVDQEGYNPLRGQFYGVEPSCADKVGMDVAMASPSRHSGCSMRCSYTNFIACLQPLRSVSFGGNGYLELASHSLRKKSSFGFAFSTLQPDTMLMVSTFQRPVSSHYCSFWCPVPQSHHIAM